MPKPLSSTSGSTIRHVVAVAVGIKEQIRRLQHVNAAVAEAQSGREVQAGDEILGLAIAAVFIGVFENRDAIGAVRSLRRRLRHAVVDGAQILIDLDRLQIPPDSGYCRY